MQVHSYNPNTQEVEAGTFKVILSSIRCVRPVWATDLVSKMYLKKRLIWAKEKMKIRTCFQLYGILEKGKTMKKLNKWPLDLGVEVGKIRAQRTFGAAQPFLMIPRWWVYTIVHLSKCQVYPSVWTFRVNHRSMSAVLRKASSCRKEWLTQRLIKIPSINNWVARSSTPTMQGTGKFLEEGAERT